MAGAFSCICCCFLLFVFVFTSQCDASRILGLFTAPSKSHLLVHTAIIDALVERGHEATVVTTGPILKKNIKYRHINLDIPGFSPEHMAKSLTKGEPSYADFMNFVNTVTGVANSSVNHDAMKQLMEKEKFDLVILGYFFNEFQIGLAAHFKCPVIISFMTKPITPLNGMVGNPKEMAYVPNMFFGGKLPMGFFARVQNFISTLLFDEIAYPLISGRTQASLYNSLPDFREIRNVYLLLPMAPAPHICVVVLFVVFLASQCDSARILGLFTAPSKSHLLIHTAIVDALVDKGHEVTVVTTAPILKKNIKYRHIQLDVPGFPPDYQAKLITEPGPLYKRMRRMINLVTTCANASLHQPAMQALMANETFDLVILGYFMNEFQLGVAAHFKCPVIVSFMARPVTFVNNLVGNPKELAYVPNLMLGETQPMGFWSRLKNFVFTSMFDAVLSPVIAGRRQTLLYNENFPPEKYPSFEQMLKNISLVFTNHHFSQGPIRPNVPAMVEIGGIQIKDKPDPLPEDLKKILDNAKHGVVYFSFGSNVQGQYLDKAKAKSMFDVLSKLPQTILWKWGESDFPGQSPNIIYKTWLPQDDILAHPNVKLFVTHGGAGSVVESQYHGVPMVGIPLFAEQHSNVATMENSGFGVGCDFPTISAESFGKAVHEVLSNNVYRNNVQRFSKLYKDRPLTAKQTAVFWTEYVLRHHGAPHMQSPAVHMNNFQLMSLDVIGFLIAVLYLVFKVIKIVFSFICSKCCAKKTKKTKRE